MTNKCIEDHCDRCRDDYSYWCRECNLDREITMRGHESHYLIIDRAMCDGGVGAVSVGYDESDNAIARNEGGVVLEYDLPRIVALQRANEYKDCPFGHLSWIC